MVMSVSTSSPRRFAAAIVAVATFVALLVVAGPMARTAHAASYTPTTLSRFDSKLVYLINRAREARGLPRLIVVAGTTDVAHNWSCKLASSRILAHNGNLVGALENHGSANWTTYAENVGYVYGTDSARDLFRAYMNSPAHKANILARSNKFIGTWTKKGSGFKWNTIDFVGSSLSAYNNNYGGARSSC
jgi:uncharacterized protein YkwD